MSKRKEGKHVVLERMKVLKKMNEASKNLVRTMRKTRINFGENKNEPPPAESVPPQKRNTNM